MKKYRLILIAANLLLLLIYFNYSVFRNEKILDSGELILLELAPVDPRSLFQGDYMQLDYAISRSGVPEGIAGKGYFIVSKDARQVAKKIRIQKSINPLSPGEFALPFKTDQFGLTKIGADAWFFQEGQAEKYAGARYGGLKIDRKGNTILEGLYGDNFLLIR